MVQVWRGNMQVLVGAEQERPERSQESLLFCLQSLLLVQVVLFFLQMPAQSLTLVQVLRRVVGADLGPQPGSSSCCGSRREGVLR